MKAGKLAEQKGWVVAIIPMTSNIVDGQNRSSRVAEKPKSVEFHYIKSSLYRVIHADGIVGAATPNGGIHCSFFSERPAIPTRLVHELDEQGSLGGEIERNGRSGFVREMDVDVMLSLGTAVMLRDWLAERIEEAEARAKPNTDALNG